MIFRVGFAIVQLSEKDLNALDMEGMIQVLQPFPHSYLYSSAHLVLVDNNVRLLSLLICSSGIGGQQC